MLEQNEFQNTPMYNALSDLAKELEKKNIPPVKLNVIGGFALMMRKIRPADGVTDIDYVGPELSQTITDAIARIGLKHNMEAGWINNDGMLTGETIESFELSTGTLHFDHAMTIGKIDIDVLSTKDLLRMKIIAVDTAMTELESTGDFARLKDFQDIQALMIAENIKPEDIQKEFGEYILCHPETTDLLIQIYEDGPKAASETVSEKMNAIQKQKKAQPESPRSVYLDNLMDSLLSRSKEMNLKEQDLDFSKKQTDQIL